ncbi:MAG: tripartite tricarboxylate transporter TctB family protein [Alphaproteobacteria bacterium]|nr:tripartite tricarboxylate transporter TctB family protein [Alphaproteobacteria bacterium]
MAELLLALTFAALSAYLMIKSAELPIGWIPDEGPGGGAWPFWLSAVMLGSCIWVLVNWVLRIGPVANNDGPLFEAGMFAPVFLVAAALTICIGLIEGIGVGGFGGIGFYGALPLFLAFYLKVMGNHSWMTTILTAVLVPVVTFLFFEIMLKITLPKGMTDPLFIPVYAFFYGL